jgi:Na+/H+-dicarboxylate symporter
MKKSFVYFLAVAVMGLTLGLVSQDKMAPGGATGSTGSKKSGGKKGGTGSTGKMGGKKGGTGSTGKM